MVLKKLNTVFSFFNYFYIGILKLNLNSKSGELLKNLAKSQF